MKRFNSLLTAVALAVLSAGIATAEDISVERIARMYNNLDHLNQVRLVEGAAFVAADINGLQIFDTSNPMEISLLGYWNENACPVASVVLGDHYAFTVGGNEITALDIADFANPQLAGSLVSQQFVNLVGTFRYDRYLYVADEGAGIYVIDIYDPANMSVLGFTALEGVGMGITEFGDALVAGDREGKISFFDMSDPFVPALISQIDLQCNIRDIGTEGNYIYAACGSLGLYVVEVDEDNGLELAGHLLLENDVNGLAVRGDRIYIASSAYNPKGEAATYGRLEIIDISDPEAPYLARNLMLKEEAWMTGVAVFDDEVVVIGDRGLLHSVNIIDDMNPVNDGVYEDWGMVYDIAVSGDVACVAERFEGFRAVDISDPAHPVEIFQDHANMANAVAVSGNYGYLLNGDMGVFIYDIAPGAVKRELGLYQTGYYNHDFAVQNQIAYLVNQARQLLIVDLTNPAEPIELGSMAFEEIPHSIQVVGDIAYVVSDGISVVSVADPANPVLLDFAWQNGINDIAVMGNYLYAACGSDAENGPGLAVFNTWDEVWFRHYGTYAIGSANPGITVHDGYAFIADGQNGIQVVDVHDPMQPVGVANFDTPGLATKLTEHDGVIYVADQTNLGCYELTIANAANTVKTGGELIGSTGLLSVYPNPFNSVTRLNWLAPASSPVNLAVYNITGAKVVELMNGVSSGGRGEALFNANGLPAGAYVIRLESAGKSWSQQVRLVR